MMLDTEATVIANFEFLGHTDMDMEEEEGDGDDEIYDANTDTKPNKASIFLLAEDVDTDAEAEVLNELNFLTEIEESPPGSIHLEMNSSKGLLHRGLQQDPRRPNNKEGRDSTLEFGELQLCVNNDAEISYDFDLFERSDNLCKHHGCEKISTLGDCCFCVSGCSEPRYDHTKCCIEMGLAWSHGLLYYLGVLDLVVILYVINLQASLDYVIICDNIIKHLLLWLVYILS
ncbi:uncharacterized protein LOC105187875 isoform X2 [Harpegnathos saltator]|nr:uncharacterized protein LOC105187875 isoform X2 [Harpegnathos saltator]